MDAAFATVGQTVIETIHQERLAAPHPAPDIKAPWYIRTKQAAAQKLITFVLEIDELLPERLQFFDRCGLRRIACKTCLIASRLVPGPGSHAFSLHCSHQPDEFQRVLIRIAAEQRASAVLTEGVSNAGLSQSHL